jgi:tetraacyldisaccharide 4'-kinase
VTRGRTFASPVARLYERVAGWRRAWYGRHADRIRRLDRPVISVGNLVVGGSGKTPLVAAIARLLASAGERPSILTRGYARQQPDEGVLVVSDGSRVLVEARQAGDEPYMLARALGSVPVFVCADRYLSGRLAERHFGCTVHLLDDGFQHLQLARDIDLLAVDRSNLDEEMLPLGRLREPLSAARAADALLVAGDDQDVEALGHSLGVETAFRVDPRYQPARVIAGGAADVKDADRRVVAVAGIARPERFFTALRRQGWEIAREIVFRDHHWFTQHDVDDIHRAAAETGAQLILTTEKDAVRLEEYVGRSFTPRPAGREGPPYGRMDWAYVPLELVIEPADVFAGWLAGRLADARRVAPVGSTALEGGAA